MSWLKRSARAVRKPLAPYQGAVRDAARQGAACAARHPDPAKAVSVTLAALPYVIRDDVRVSVTRPNVAGKQAVVTVTYGKATHTERREVIA